VSVLTFHRAKGLEWPVVFVTGLEDGLVPSARARTEEARAEEGRLLYVALSRAGHELHCSWAERRTAGGRLRDRSPSPWVAALRAAVVTGGGIADRAPAGEPGGGPGAAAAALAASRSRLSEAARRPRRHPAGRPADGERSGAPAAPARPAVAAAPDGREAERGDELARRLDRWRRVRARAAGVDPDVVLDPALVAAIARTRPADRDALAGLGLGPVATHRFGDDLLALLGPGPDGRHPGPGPGPGPDGPHHDPAGGPPPDTDRPGVPPGD
jgi:DNA helicase-2/ATP-dependent DNA helicase PcrA